MRQSSFRRRRSPEKKAKTGRPDLCPFPNASSRPHADLSFTRTQIDEPFSYHEHRSVSAAALDYAVSPSGLEISSDIALRIAKPQARPRPRIQLNQDRGDAPGLQGAFNGRFTRRRRLARLPGHGCFNATVPSPFPVARSSTAKLSRVKPAIAIG